LARSALKWLQLGTHMLFKITRISDELLVMLTTTTLTDLKPLKRIFNVFFTIFGCGAHLKSELRRNY